jgi:hypothetical protein
MSKMILLDRIPTGHIVTDADWDCIEAGRARPQLPDPKPAHRLWHSTPEGRANARRYYRALENMEQLRALRLQSEPRDLQFSIPQWTEAEPQESLKPISRERYEEDQAVAAARSVSAEARRLMRILNPYYTPKGHDGPDAKWPWKRPTLAEQRWLEADWRDPRNMQVYAEPALLAELKTDWRPRPHQPLVLLFATQARPLTRHEAAAGFSLMSGLAGDRMVSPADDLALCDAETLTARAYQAAIKVLQAYYLDKRLRVEPAYLRAARIVIQCVELELLLRDLHQKQRELSALLGNPREMHALAKGKWPRLSPGSFNIVSRMLAGPSQDAAASYFERERSVLRESYNRAIFDIERKFSWYFTDLWIPPKRAGRECYNIYRDVSSDWDRFVEPKFAEANRPPLPKADDYWLVAEALEYWGGPTRLPAGLAEDYTSAQLAGRHGEWRAGRWPCVLKSGVNYKGERDYDSDPDGVLIIAHPQQAADWWGLIDALPDGAPKSKLKDKNTDIEQLLSDSKHKSAVADYFSGGQRWTSKAVKPARASARRSVSIRSPDFCGPVIEIGDKLYPRAVDNVAEPDNVVPDVVDQWDDAMTREDAFCFAES